MRTGSVAALVRLAPNVLRTRGVAFARKNGLSARSLALLLVPLLASCIRYWHRGRTDGWLDEAVIIGSPPLLLLHHPAVQCNVGFDGGWRTLAATCCSNQLRNGR